LKFGSHWALPVHQGVKILAWTHGRWVHWVAFLLQYL